MGMYEHNFRQRKLEGALASAFVRGSGDWDIGPDGIINPVAVGNNVPVFVGTDGLPLGAGRTNLNYPSADFSHAYWAKDRVTVAANTTIAPDGTLTGDTLSCNATSSYASVAETTADVSGTTYAFSAWLRAGTVTRGVMYVGASNTFVRARIMSGPGALGASGTPYQHITGLSAAEWTRVEVIFTAVASANKNRGFYAGDWGAQNAGDSIVIWGVQLEVGTFAGPYIATTTAAVARAASYVSPTLASMGLASQTNEYSFAFLVKMMHSSGVIARTDTNASYISMGAGTSSNDRFGILASTSDGAVIDATVVVGGASQGATHSGLSWSAGEVVMFAASKGATNGLISRIKSTISTNTTAGAKAEFSSPLTHVSLGTRINNVAAGCHGIFVGALFWDTALSQSSLEALRADYFGVLPNETLYERPIAARLARPLTGLLTRRMSI